MSKPPTPRPIPASLEEVITALTERSDLRNKRIRALTSAVRLICRLMAREPADVLADSKELHKALASLKPNGTDVNSCSLSNAKSLFRKALSETGVDKMCRRSRAPKSPAWEGLLKQVPHRYGRAKLTRLAAFCTSLGVEPRQLDDGTVAVFGEALKANSVPRPKQVQRDACLTWNSYANDLLAWPPQLLTVPDNSNVFAMSLAEFPSSFGEEVNRYLQHLATRDLFGDLPRQPKSPVTINNNRIQLLEIATALVLIGRDPATILSLADIVAADAAEAALTYLHDRNGQRKTGQLHNFARLLVGIAKTWVRAPEDQVQELSRLRHLVRTEKGGMTETNKARLRPFNDPANVARLLDLPNEIVRAIELNDVPTYNDAVQVQLAVAVAIVLVAPLRARNLAGLQTDRHIIRARPGAAATVHLVLPKGEVKNDVALEFVLPAAVVRLIDLYIHKYQPGLLTEPSQCLFPARKGGSKDPGPFAVQIKNLIMKHLGMTLNLHAFRHLSAYLYLKAHPGDYETVRLLLGHKNIQTTMRYYCGLEQAEAFRRYDEMLDRYRGPGRDDRLDA